MGNINLNIDSCAHSWQVTSGTSGDCIGPHSIVVYTSIDTAVNPQFVDYFYTTDSLTTYYSPGAGTISYTDSRGEIYVANIDIDGALDSNNICT